MNAHAGFILAIGILTVFLGAALFLWLIAKTRRGTFFSVWVSPDFANSDSGRAIMRSFRRRVWLWSLLASALYAAASFGFGGPSARIANVTTILIIIGYAGAFAIATKETRASAPRQPGPPSRTAALFTAEEEQSLGLSIVDWLTILLPVILVVVTALLFVLAWSQIPSDKKPLMILVGIVAPIAIASSLNYFALRYRARSADWNADPKASRKYRTMLGIATASFPTFFTFLICLASVFVAVPLSKGTEWLLVEVFLWALFLGFPLVFIAFLGFLWWLRRNVSAESGDPMPDACWKWGYFYFNSDDPALVVPWRSGIRFSYNYARPPVWWLVAAPMIVLILLAFIGSSHSFFQLPR